MKTWDNKISKYFIRLLYKNGKASWLIGNSKGDLEYLQKEITDQWKKLFNKEK